MTHGSVSRSIRLLTGDCIDLMPCMATRFDAIITSPPYDAKKEYEEKRNFANYEAFAKLWTAAIPDLLKPTGSLWLNLGYTKLSANEALPLTYVYYPILHALGLKLVQEIVWQYAGGMAYRRRFSHRSERWQWWAHDPDAATFNLDEVREPEWASFDTRNNPLGKNPTDVWSYNRVSNNSREKTAHPCQFPEAMIERIVKASTHAGDNILDPFAGSGTVLSVAQRLERNATGIEKNSKYVREARKRLHDIAVRLAA